MPLVANSKLPTFERLRGEGGRVLSRRQAEQQDIRELHIGLLNMMPDAAIEATERQFFRLVGESNQIAQFYMHPFTLPQLPRNDSTQQYIDQHYDSFDKLKQEGLDALIITGANVTQPDLSAEPFWEPLIEVIDWASQNVASVICSCLATHAVMQFRHGQKRQRLPKKRWGVYSHQVVDRVHPLVIGTNTMFDVPHSRFNEITREQFEAAGLKVLAESPKAGVHLAVSEDLIRVVYFQGHPEYDSISLLKEYKREVVRFARGELEQYPPFPKHYFDAHSRAILSEFEEHLVDARDKQAALAKFPEQLITARLHNTWHDSAEAVINNWLGKVYQITNNDRRLLFMEGVDPDDPLGLRK